jgi:hypothetical protein
VFDVDLYALPCFKACVLESRGQLSEVRGDRNLVSGKIEGKAYQYAPNPVRWLIRSDGCRGHGILMEWGII